MRDALAWAEERPGAVLDLFATVALAEREPALLQRAERAGVRTSCVTDKAMSALADTVTPQGVAVVARLVTAELEPTLETARLVVVLVGATDPGNAGTVIRTADAAGADAVVVTGDAVDPHNPKCVRATMGSLFHVPVVAVRDADRVTTTARAAGLRIVAADGDGEAELGPETDALLAGPTAWLFGSEAHGLPDDVAERADARVRVPIHGRAESLNLASAAAVCLYASARNQRDATR